MAPVMTLSAIFSHSAGALYGTYEAFRYKVPGLYKVRYIGQVRLRWLTDFACR